MVVIESCTEMIQFLKNPTIYFVGGVVSVVLAYFTFKFALYLKDYKNGISYFIRVFNTDWGKKVAKQELRRIRKARK